MDKDRALATTRLWPESSNSYLYAVGTAHTQLTGGSQDIPIPSIETVEASHGDEVKGKGARDPYSRPLTDAQALDLLTTHKGLAQQYQKLCAARLGEYKASLQAQYNERLHEIEEYARKWRGSNAEPQGAAAQSGDGLRWQDPVALGESFKPSVPAVSTKWHEAPWKPAIARPPLWTDATGLVQVNKHADLVAWLRETPEGLESYLESNKATTPGSVKLTAAIKDYTTGVNIAIVQTWVGPRSHHNVLTPGPAHREHIVIHPTRNNLAVIWQLYSLLKSRKMHLVKCWNLQYPGTQEETSNEPTCKPRVGELLSRLGPKSHLFVATAGKGKQAVKRRVVIARPQYAKQGTDVVVKTREIRTGAAVLPEAGDVTIFEQEEILVGLTKFFNSMPDTELDAHETWFGLELGATLPKAPAPIGLKPRPAEPSTSSSAPGQGAQGSSTRCKRPPAEDVDNEEPPAKRTKQEKPAKPAKPAKGAKGVKRKGAKRVKGAKGGKT